MDTAAPRTTDRFRAKEAGVILLAVIFTIMLADYFLVQTLEFLRASTVLLKGKTDGELLALRSISSGIINPLVLVSVSALIMKIYMPRESLKCLCTRIGLVGWPSARMLGITFCGGAAYLFAFMGLEVLFPRSAFATAHPVNVINNAGFGGKVLFALTACTLVPVAEEVLFRGILYDGFANSWGKIVSAVCVSTIFISLHPDSLESGYWLTHVALYLSPVVLILLREGCATLYAPIAAHAGINFAEIFF